jgi:repressor LexA
MYDELDDIERRIVDVIRTATATGVPPSIREIGQAVGLHSPNSVFMRLKKLEAKGVVRRQPHGKRGVRVIELAQESASVPVPLLGHIQAGEPILAEEQVEHRYLMPYEFVGDGELFMLRVRGDSMTGAGISDGDYVVVRSQPHASHGETSLPSSTTALQRLRSSTWPLTGPGWSCGPPTLITARSTAARPPSSARSSP